MSHEIIDVSREKSLRMVSLVSYTLHTIVAVGAVVPGGQGTTLLLILAFILDLLKREEAQGTWYASHFDWRIHTVLWAMVAYAITAPLWLLLLVPGWLAWIAVSVWFLWRIVKGFMALQSRRPAGPLVGVGREESIKP